MALTQLRGIVFLAGCLFGLPHLAGVPGIWLAVPLSERHTFCVVVAIYTRDRPRSNGSLSH